jgi:hypothetical protein
MARRSSSGWTAPARRRAGVVACEIKTGYVWPLDIIERPDNLTREQIESTSTTSDRATVRSVTPSSAISVWRCYCDPQWIGDS